jgi:hypothetical protein
MLHLKCKSRDKSASCCRELWQNLRFLGEFFVAGGMARGWT